MARFVEFASGRALTAIEDVLSLAVARELFATERVAYFFRSMARLNASASTLATASLALCKFVDFLEEIGCVYENSSALLNVYRCDCIDCI